MTFSAHRLSTALQHRVAALEAAFVQVATHRMAGVPVLNPALRVRALGFGLHADAGEAQPAWGLGVLITPWFMNLVRLPLGPAARVPGVGNTTARLHGGLLFDCIAAQDPAVGAYEACSLFSPMFEFADQGSAEAVAHEVLRQLRPAPIPAPAPARHEPMPARRGFLLARRRGGAAP